MPNWEDLFGDLRAVEVALWIVAAGILLGLVIKLWPFVKNAVAIVDALVTLPATGAAVKQLTTTVTEMKTKVASIHHELHPNGGTSMNDAVRRMEGTTERLELGVRGLYDKVADLAAADEQLAAADERIRAEIENTNPPKENDR